jgi:hypothetical protein
MIIYAATLIVLATGTAVFMTATSIVSTGRGKDIIGAVKRMYSE